MGALWPSLPAVNQDEYLSLAPLTWFSKPPQARSPDLAQLEGEFLGVRFPNRAYSYVGAVKAFMYHTTGLSTELSSLRAFNAAVFAVFFFLSCLITINASVAPWTALAIFTGLFVTDTSLIVLAITDEGPIVVGFLFAALLVMTVLSTLTRPSLRLWPALVVIAFVGVWDRINFVWYLAAALAGTVIVEVLLERERRGLRVVLVATAALAALLALHLVVPPYIEILLKGIVGGHAATDFARHLRTLLAYTDPFGAFHRYVDVGDAASTRIYLAYRALFCFGCLGVIAACVWQGTARRRADPVHARGLLFFGAFVGTVALAIVATPHTWSSHHIVLCKPFLYIATALLVAGARIHRRACVALISVVILFSGYTGARALADLRSAKPVGGVYGVSWNAVDAWRAAVASPVGRVYALDWGVFYPGIVNSAPEQRWYMSAARGSEQIWGLTHGRTDEAVGLLSRTGGRKPAVDKSVLADGRLRIESQTRFADHPGEGWTFTVIRNQAPGADTPKLDNPANNLVGNSMFRELDDSWIFKYTPHLEPTAVQVEFLDCGPSGIRCAKLSNLRPVDSRLTQVVGLAAATTYMVSAQVRTQGVDGDRIGAHVAFVSHPNIMSADLRGNSGWQSVRFFVVTGAHPRTIELALRLGSWGSTTTGSAWFTRAVVRPIAAVPIGAVVHKLN